MISTDERNVLQVWFDAFDPAVHVELLNDELVVWSRRPNRGDTVVRCGRTADLYQDLRGALAQLVDRLS